jgi:hypothetical protein
VPRAVPRRPIGRRCRALERIKASCSGPAAKISGESNGDIQPFCSSSRMSPFPPPNSYPDKGPRPRLGVSVRSNWTGPVVQLDDLSGWLHRPAEWLNEWMDWPAPIGIGLAAPRRIARTFIAPQITLICLL